MMWYIDMTNDIIWYIGHLQEVFPFDPYVPVIDPSLNQNESRNLRPASDGEVGQPDLGQVALLHLQVGN